MNEAGSFREPASFLTVIIQLTKEKTVILHFVRIYLRHIVFFVAVVLAALSAMGQQQALTQITGLVRDSVSGEGVPYASISLVGTSEGTMAGESGGFTINSRARFSKLRVSAMGYRAKEVPVRTGQGSVVLIDLAPTGVELSELVVRKGKEHYSKKNNPAVDLIKELQELAEWCMEAFGGKRKEEQG